MKTIYIVEGQTGEYSDHQEWPVRAFVSEEKAKQFVEELTQEYHRLRGEYGTGFLERDKIIKNNKLDPNMLCDYTGTTYHYYSVELDEE